MCCKVGIIGGIGVVKLCVGLGLMTEIVLVVLWVGVIGKHYF